MKKETNYVAIWTEENRVFYGILQNVVGEPLRFTFDLLGQHHKVEKGASLLDKVKRSASIIKKWEALALKPDYISVCRVPKIDLGDVNTIVWSMLDSTDLSNVKDIHKVRVSDQWALNSKDSKFNTDILSNIFGVEVTNKEMNVNQEQYKKMRRILLTMCLNSYTEINPDELVKFQQKLEAIEDDSR